MMEMNLTDLFESYTSYWHNRSDVSEYTKRSYIGVIRSFMKFSTRRVELPQSCSDEDLRELAVEYTDWVTNELGYSISSANLTASALTSFFITCGVEQPELNRQKALRRRPQTLDANELRTFIDVVQECQFVRDRLIAKCFLYLGLKVKECHGLRITDVVNQEGVIYLNISSRSSSKLITDLRPDFQQDLQEWLKIRESIRPGNDGLLVTRMGARLSIGSITFVVRRLGLQARLVLAPQILRNTCVSSVASETTDLHAIAAAGGFRTLDSARRYAAH